MCMGMENAGYSHSFRGIPMGMGTKLHKLMGMGREWEIAQMEMGTLIINVFPFNHNFPNEIFF